LIKVRKVESGGKCGIVVFCGGRIDRLRDKSSGEDVN
jgi:hypothetical protein